VRFDKKAGVLTEYRYQGVTVLERGPLPDFWRAPTNNDRGAWKAFRLRRHQQEPGHRAVARGRAALGRQGSARRKVDGATARVAVRADLPVVGATYAMTYTIHGDGDVGVECSYQPGTEKLSMMPRFGTELVVAPGFENIAWYGRGPKETLIDRLRAHRRVSAARWTRSGWSTCARRRTETRPTSAG
jgi:beta-galactosidase